MKRNDIAWWIIVRTLRHVASEQFGENIIKKLAGDQKEYKRVFYPSGTVLRSKCFGCETVFEQTMSRDQEIPAQYHSKTCRNDTRLRRRKEPTRGCPTPHKIAYPNPTRAQDMRTLLGNDDRANLENFVYQCQCKKYHLGHGKFEIVKEGTWSIA